MLNLKTIIPVAFAILAGSSAFVSTTTGCDEPAPKCSSSRGDYIVRYTYVSGADTCKDLIGEKVGVQTYNAIGENGKPNLDVASIAIQADSLGTLFDNASNGGVSDPDPNDKEYALGGFNSATPVGNVCSVPTLSVAQQQLGAVAADDAGTTEQPATLINYEWKNMQFLVTSQYLGSQFTADVDIGRDGKDCIYKAQGLYPYVDCTLVDVNGKMVPDANGNPQPDPNACLPEATPPIHVAGSGINPDFQVHCDPMLLACVLNRADFPAIK